MGEEQFDKSDDAVEGDWGELGSTTSPRAWIALAAFVLVVITFSVWGIFGTVPVQSELPATITNVGTPIEIAAGRSGSVVLATFDPASQEAQNTSQVFKKGQELMSIKPFAGGSAVPVVAPTDMTLAFQVVEGMPVEPSTVVADGYRRDEDAAELIFAVTSLANLSIIKSAERITVAAADPRLSQESRTIKIDRVGQVPLTEAQIANVIGNPIAARKAFTDAGGAPYAVFFSPTSPGEQLRGRASAAAIITVTIETPHPLSLLLSG
jgi:hypothetical protein